MVGIIAVFLIDTIIARLWVALALGFYNYNVANQLFLTVTLPLSFQ